MNDKPITSDARRHGIAASTVWNSAGVLLSGVVSFALAPMMIRSLGEFYYGVWIVANSTLSYYALFDGGLSLTIQRFVALYRGNDDENSAAEAVNTAVMLVIGIAIGLFALTGIAVVVAPTFLNIAAHDVLAFRSTLLLLGGSIALSFPARPMGAYLRGIHRFDLCNALSIGALLIRAVSVLAALHLSGGIIGVGIATLVSSLASLIGHIAVLRHIEPKLLHWVLPRWRSVHELSKFSFYVFLTTLGDYLRFHVDAIVVAKCVSIASVTYYSVCSSLVAFYVAVLCGISAPLMTELVRLGGKPNDAQVKFFFFASKITMFAAALGGALLFSNGADVLRLWLGARFVSAYPVLCVLVVAHLFDVGQAPSLHMLYATGKHAALGGWTILEGIFNLCLSVYLARQFGIVGVAIGTAVPMLLVKVIVQPCYTLSVAGIRVGEYLSRSVLKPVAVGIIVVMVCWVGVGSPVSIGALLIKVAWQTGLFGSLTYLFVLGASERKSLVRIVANWFPHSWQPAAEKQI